MSKSVRSAKRALTQVFSGAGLPFAEDDALEIILAATGFDNNAMILRGSESLTRDMSALVEAYKYRRLSGEPIDNILGWREFYGRRFQISKDVLSPRADTETLIRGALKRIDKTGAPALLDLGTGSGAIGLTLLAEIANAHLIATDLSGAALNIAKANADSLDLTERASFYAGAWWGAVPANAAFDIILSNPPYITDSAMKALEREVLDFDPDVALRGGSDGLDAYRAIISGAPEYLKANGWLGLEIGYDQAAGLKLLLKSETWQNITVTKDLGGLDRVVWAQISAEI
jgi:release factor glutamine methyltransferase